MKKLFAALFGRNGRHSTKKSQDDLSEINGQSRFLELIEMERNRVHRSNRQFSLILLNVDPHRNREVAVGDLAGLIRKRVRLIDVVGWYDNCHLGVLLPNTSAAGAEKVAKVIAMDLCGNSPDLLGSVPYRTLSYPDSNNAER